MCPLPRAKVQIKSNQRPQDGECMVFHSRLLPFEFIFGYFFESGLSPSQNLNSGLLIQAYSFHFNPPPKLEFMFDH